MRKLGTITPGQAPRSDITPILEAALPKGTTLMQRGILDGLSAAEIATRFAPVEGEAVIVSRLLDGNSAVMDKQTVEAAFQAEVDTLEDAGCQSILLLCTGKFDHLTTRKARLIEPQKLIAPALAPLTEGLRLGVIVPHAGQIQSEAPKWQGLEAPPLYAAVSPYLTQTESLAAAAADLAAQGAEILLLDCMGFVEHHRAAARAASGRPVILSTALIAKLVAEVV